MLRCTLIRRDRMSRREQPYIPFYASDFLSDEKLRECSAESVGVYIMLMCLLHKQEEYGVILLKQKDKQNENNILNFAFKLSKHLPFDVDVIKRALDELIELDVIQLDGDNGDRLSQKRMVKDAQLSQKRAEAGKKGGTARVKKNNTVASDFAQAKMQANSENEIVIENNNIDTNNIKNDSIKSNTVIQKERLKNQFAEFWKEYPRKVAKAKAEKAWESVKPTDEVFEKIMQAVRRQKLSEQWRKDNGQYIPHPTTWLNQKRWEDEIDISSSLPKGGMTNGELGTVAKHNKQEAALEGFATV